MRKMRTQTGSNLVEGVASMVLVLPMVLTLVAVVIEVNSFLLIKNVLDDAARVAARNCAMAYHWPAYGVAQAPSGTAYSPDAQGDTVAPPTTAGSDPSASPKVSGTAGGAATSGIQPQSANDAFARVRMTNIVTSNAQFSAIYTPASVNDLSNPAFQTGHVTVTVSSKPGVFPTPDVLNLKNLMPTLVITSSSTYSL